MARTTVETDSRGSGGDRERRTTVGIVLSKQALDSLQRKAEALGMSRNELIRQVLYGIAFKNELEAA